MGSFSKTVLPFNTAFPLQHLKPFTAAIFVSRGRQCVEFSVRFARMKRLHGKFHPSKPACDEQDIGKIGWPGCCVIETQNLYEIIIVRWSYTKQNVFQVFQQCEDFIVLNCCILLPISINVTLLNVVAMVTKISVTQ